MVNHLGKAEFFETSYQGVTGPSRKTMTVVVVVYIRGDDLNGKSAPYGDGQRKNPKRGVKSAKPA